MKLEDKLRRGLLGHLSEANTQVDITIACNIARDFTIDFLTFFAENCYEIDVSKLYYIRDSEEHPYAYTVVQLLKIFEDGL